jgi:hypothetical protein
VSRSPLLQSGTGWLSRKGGQILLSRRNSINKNFDPPIQRCGAICLLALFAALYIQERSASKQPESTVKEAKMWFRPITIGYFTI